MKHEQAPITDFCTREGFKAGPARVLDAATQAPVVVKAPNGRFTIEFVPGEKRSVAEWAISPGQLEDGDSF